MRQSTLDEANSDQAVDRLSRLRFQQLENAFATVTRTAAQVNEVDRISIWLFSDDSQSLNRVYDFPEEERRDFSYTLDISDSPDYPQALRDRSVLRFQKRSDQPERAGETAQHYLRESGTHSLLNAAIYVKASLAGVLCYEQCDSRQWSDRERELALRIAGIIGHAIEADRRRRSVAMAERCGVLVQESSDAIALCLPNGGIEYLNPKARQLLGLARDEPLLGLRIVDFVQSESRQRAIDQIYPAASDKGSWTGYLKMCTRRGDAFEATVTLNVYHHDEDEIAYLSCTVRSAPPRPDLERQIAEIHARYEAALAQSGDCMVVVDVKCLTLRSVSGGFEALLGYTAAQQETLSLYDLADKPPDKLRAEIEQTCIDGQLLCGERRICHAEGHWIDVEMSMMRIEQGGEPSISLRVRDIGERLQRRRDIERLAYYDPLTGLANSNLLRERAETMLAESMISGRPVGFILLQIDRWQRILDIQGYQVAESLLQQVGNRLKNAFSGHGVLLARVLGGVEFGLLFEGGQEQAQALVSVAQDAFRRSFRADRQSLHLSMRSGSAHAPAHAVNFKDLTKRAGIALRNAHLRNLEHREYDPTQSGRLHDERLIEEDLRNAIGTKQIRLRYQPISEVGHQEFRATAVEVLVRWRHPQLGLLMPADFIPLAEESKLIVELDRQILSQAAQAAAGWDGVLRHVALSVNISMVTLMNGDLVSILREVLADSGLAPARLCLEITETAIMHDRVYAAAMLGEVNALGVHVALDDFGTGYSSLAYLKDLPVDVLKIDRDFIRGIGTDSRDEYSIQTIIQLARDLGMRVLAEGVETQAQLEWLAARDIDFLQGFYIGMPLTLGDLRKRRPRWRALS